MEFKTEYINSDIDPFYVGSNAASISHDGNLLATANLEDVVITNLQTNQIVRSIEGDGEDITNLIMTPDGTKLAILSQSQQLRVVDLVTGDVIKSFKMPSPVYVSAADPTSSLFAFGGTDGVVTVWDIDGGYVTHSLKGHGTTISSLEFHGTLNTKDWKLASGDTMGTVKVWGLVKRKASHTFKEHNSAVRGVGFSQSGEYFLSGGRDQIVIIYKNFKPIKTLMINQQIETAGFIDLPGARSNELHFYTGGSDNLFKIYEVNSGKLVCQTANNLKTEEELIVVDAMPLIDDHVYLFISDQTLAKIDLNHISGGVIPAVSRIAGNHGIIADIKYVGPDFDLLALATNSPSLRIVNPQKPLELILCEGHRDLLNVVDVSTDGKWIATGSKDNEARLWRWNDQSDTFEPYAIFKGHIGSVTALSLPKTPIGEYPKFLITASTDLTLKKWRVPKPQGEEVQIVKSSDYTRRAHDKDINSIDISPNDEFIGTASYDKLGKIWDLESGETIGVLKGHRRGLWDIKFCKYDKLVITSAGDKTVKLWSLKTFQIEQNFESHTNSVQKISFMNHQYQTISGGADGLIKIWDNKTGECLKTIDNHNNRIWSIDVKEDGEQFVSCDANGKISLWKDNSQDLIAQKEVEKIEKIENDQKLNNLIHQQDYKNAFLVALELNYSMKLFEIVKKLIKTEDDDQFSEIIGGLNENQLVLLFKKIQSWNINFKNFEVTQKLVHVTLKSTTVEKLKIPPIVKIIDNLIPFNERHLNKIDNLLEQSFIINYAVEQMNV